MLATEKAPVGAQWRRVRSPEKVMFGLVHHRGLLLRECAPEEKDDPGALVAHQLDDRIRDFLPALVFVGVGLGLLHSQARVEEEDTLVSPAREIAVAWKRTIIGDDRRHLDCWQISKIYSEYYLE